MKSPTFRLLFGGLLLFVLLRIIYSRLKRRSIIRQYGCKSIPRYPHRDRFFGIDLFLRYKKAFEERDFKGLNQRLFSTYGKVFECNFLGTRLIKTMNPDITKYVHATYFDNFGVEKIRSGAEYLWGDGITVTEGERWAARRKLIKPAFDAVHISNLENRGLEKHVERLMELLPRDGETVDLMPLFKRLSLDTASEFIFGESMDALLNPDAAKDFLDAFWYAQKGSGLRVHLLGKRLSFLHRDPKWYQSCDIAIKFLDERVDRAIDRVKQGKPTDRLIDQMAQASSDRLTLRSQMQNVFTPAHDGAAVTLSNIFFHLSRNPEAWAKLRAEILPTAHLPITYDLLKSYNFLKNVVRETHRITPISVLIQRQCIKPVVFPTGGGNDGMSPLYVDKDDIVEMNFACIMKDSSYWGEDAEDFRPERWESLRPRPTWEYTPFGGGPRVCPGFRLVFAEVAYTLVTILRKYKGLESRDDRPWTEDTRSTFQNLHGAKVALMLA
ncbi:cytochrome P450 monooxygenase [Lophiotrema nucula]|uniref:Cytochrome P450 monooxygenase n=1 Tax=Lophiotrema nucula TaxID=690887 RepID=A0A6A5Z2F8_9PLEO|nr:cytochrome P450 monooxygenase [Lophiotrema nucula]